MSDTMTTILTATLSALGGGGLWGVISSIVNKRKSPFDMLMAMMSEQKRFYERKNIEYEREKADSAEKSHVIAQSGRCPHRFRDESIICPVEEENDKRLRHRCEVCRTEAERAEGGEI